MYISSLIEYKKIETLTRTIPGEFDMLFVELQNDIAIGVVYRPPNSRIPAFLEILEDILQYFTNAQRKVIICGDFNINTKDNPNTKYQQLLLSYGFENHISSPTRVTETSSSTIDHILTNLEPAKVEAGVIQENVADHFPTHITVNVGRWQSTKISGCHSLRWDYKKTKQRLHEKDFAGTYDSDVNVAYKNFFAMLESSCVRRKFNSRRAEYLFSPICPWMTDSILKVIRNKEHWCNKMKQHKNNTYFKEQYRIARNLSLALMRKRKKQYYSNLILKANGNSKEMWRIINSVTKKQKPCIKLPDSNILGCDSSGLLEMFNESFINVGNQFSSKNSDEEYISILPSPLQNSFVFEEITAEEIVQIAKQMPANKAAGADEITVNILKDNIEILCHPLKRIFNLSFESGMYPEELKTGRVTPIFKADDPNNITNYRPITLLSCINILFEKLIAKRMLSYIDKYNILTKNQHGFRKNYSTATAVHSATEAIYNALNNNHFALGIFLDIKKAFDSVNHEILLSKLERYGFRGPAIKFFRSYLTNRRQFVQIAQNKSSIKQIDNGVPQGSVLGPILFSLFINDYPSSLYSAQAVLYADDTALVVTHSSLTEVQSLGNKELQNTLKWFNANKLLLNTKKTKYVLFASHRKKGPRLCTLKIGGVEIEQVHRYKYLGITLDASLHWAPHIEELSRKLAYGCYTLINARKHFNKETLRIIYFSVFHSHLTYCIESWGFTYASYLAPINILQKRALKIMLSVPRTSPSAPIFKELKIMPFEQVRDYKTAILVNRVLTTNTPYQSAVFTMPLRDTRHACNNNINFPKVHNVYGRRLISFIGAKVWNHLPMYIKSVPNFVPTLKKYILSECCFSNNL